MAPEEIAGLIEELSQYLVERPDWSQPGKYQNLRGDWRCCLTAQLVERVRAALEQQAREILGWRAAAYAKTMEKADLQERIAELEAERDRLQKWNELRAQDIITLGQKVAELEAERTLPLPGEVTMLCNWLRNLSLERQTCKDAALLLEGQADRIAEQVREIERLHSRIVCLENGANGVLVEELISARERIAELEAEREEIKRAAVNQAERLRIAEEQRDALGNAGRMDLARIAELEAEADNLDERFTLGQARIKELAAERDQWQKAAGSGQLIDLYQEMRVRDDVIRAQTREECAVHVEHFLESRIGAQTAASIRALNPKPSAETEEARARDDAIGAKTREECAAALMEKRDSLPAEHGSCRGLQFGAQIIRALNQPKPSAETE